MELIMVTNENLAQEHICCAISSNKDCQVMAKKEWLSERLNEELVFLKCNVRGKCFIEYIPAEKAWAPVDAAGYMYINCLWVSGKYKGQGYSNLLLEACLKDSQKQGKKGLVILSAKKKRSFLADQKYLEHKQFVPADTAAPDYELMYLPFEASAEKPQFKPQVKQPLVEKPGFVLYYSKQCPFTAKYVPLAEAAARARNVPMQIVLFQSAEQAQAAPAPFTSYSLFYNGKFLTNEILSEKKFEKLIETCVK